MTQKADPIKITDSISIPYSELAYTFSRSSKPGGQNVNKVNTRVTLWFDIANSVNLTTEQKNLVASRLSARINKRGKLWVVSYKFRTQGLNKKAATERLVTLLQEALHKNKQRKKTKPSRSVQERRLANKKARTRIKQSRKKAINQE